MSVFCLLYLGDIFHCPPRVDLLNVFTIITRKMHSLDVDLYCVEWDVKPYSTQLKMWMESHFIFVSMYIACTLCGPQDL